jgi:hypothetical protein
MSLNKIFNKLFFKKLKPDKVVATKGDKAFQKLTETPTGQEAPPLTGLDPENFNLGWLLLKPGTYTLTATVSAPSLRLAESERSNSVEYTVK